MDTNMNTEAAEHKQAAEQVVRAKGLVGQALGEIDDISRGMKETSHDGKKVHSENESRNLSPAERHADQARREH